MNTPSEDHVEPSTERGSTDAPAQPLDQDGWADVSADDSDIGWGDVPAPRDQWYLEERPPHHG